MKSGFVSLIGKPNVGKSTILNAILNQEISIVTNKAQTTRNSVSGIYEDGDSQIIFLDTPGIHKNKDLLDKYMNKASYNSIRSSDVVVLILDSSKDFDNNDSFIFDHLKFDNKLIIAFNKIDLTNVVLINKLKEKIKTIYPNYSSIIELCGLDKFNIAELINEIKKFLPESPKIYENREPKDIKFVAAEIIRKNVLKFCREEVPHSIFVKINDAIEEDNKININGKIICEKDSQKGILIGKNASMIKKIGTKSRIELESKYNKKINLSLIVIVNRNWKNDEKFLKENKINEIK